MDKDMRNYGDARPRRGRDGGKKRGLSYGEFFFLNLELTAEEQRECLLWLEHHEASWEMVEYLLAEGCKVSFALDERGGGCLCSAAKRRVGDGDAGAILTGRGGTPGRALGVLMYKVLVLCAEGSWREAADLRRGERGEIG